MNPVAACLLSVCLVLALPVGAQERVRCAGVLAAFRAVTTVDDGTKAGADCLTVNLDAFTLNRPAATRAAPVTDPAALIGTWLGDDVSLFVTGVMTPGQEVLRIEEGPQPGTLRLRQYWYRAFLPPDYARTWDAERAYRGQVSEVVLAVDDRGRFRLHDPVDGRVRYLPLQPQFRRTNALYVLARLNHFENSGQFLMDDQTLVLDSLRDPMPPAIDQWTNIATYTRVADAAPDLALRMVQIFEVSQGRYFDCLVHQISDGRGPLFDVLNNVELAEFDRILSDLVATHYEIEDRLAEMRDPAITPRPNARDELLALADARNATRQSPVLVTIADAIETDALGCPAFF